MGRSAFRGLVSSVLVVLFPIVSFAAESTPAMLYTNGAAWINGAHVPRPSLAIFSGDLLQTRSDSVAHINGSGSSVTVLADSLVQFEGSSVRINHGGVAVSTSKQMGTTAGDVKVTPASNDWTEFNVTDFDGTVRIAARKGDLLVSDGQNTVTLPQGQETTRDETTPDSSGKKKKKQQAGAPAAATGGILNSPWAIGAGAVAVGGVATWVLIKNDEPASPAKP
jgi:hypothetical protein